MIVAMQKITLLVTEKSLTQSLHKLRSLGLVHIRHLQQPSAEGIVSLEHRLRRVEKVLDIIGNVRTERRMLKEEEISQSIKEILSLDSARKNLKVRLQELNSRLAWFEEWGDVSGHSFLRLETKGVFIRLFRCSRDQWKKIPEEKMAYIIKEKGQDLLCAMVTRDSEEPVPGERTALPPGDIHQVRSKIDLTRGALDTIEKWLKTLCGCKGCFEKYRQSLLKRKEMFQVRFGMKHEPGFSCLQGYCPKEDVEKIRACAEEQGWGLGIETPDEPEEVPTLVRTPAWLKIIEPVFKFMGTVPGYKEFDISFWFLSFLSLFFAMLIGDAGYGLIFLGLTLWARRKFSAAPQQPFTLIYVFSSATIIWGTLSGTWFGVEQIARLPLFRDLIIPRLSSFPGDEKFVMFFCFLIGAIHLTIAHALLGLRRKNSLKALAQAGWIMITWAVFYVAGLLVLGNPFPDFARYLLFAGMGLVLLFSNFQKNILKGILVSLANLPLAVISSFADTLSYLRLYAVGLATVMVAVSFNNMAMQVGFNSILSGFLSAVILFFGHALNLVLGLMSVLVHGIRLNMLEFSGHMDMEWSGKEYKPFKE